MSLGDLTENCSILFGMCLDYMLNYAILLQFQDHLFKFCNQMFEAQTLYHPTHII